MTDKQGLSQDVAKACAALDEEAKSLGYPRHKYADLLRAQAARIAELDKAHHSACLATHRQAECIHQVAAICGPDYSATVDALPKAVRHAIAIARADALRDAADVCDTSQFINFSEKNAVVVIHNRILALIERTDT